MNKPYQPYQPIDDLDEGDTGDPATGPGQRAPRTKTHAQVDAEALVCPEGQRAFWGRLAATGSTEGWRAYGVRMIQKLDEAEARRVEYEELQATIDAIVGKGG